MERRCNVDHYRWRHGDGKVRALLLLARARIAPAGGHCATLNERQAPARIRVGPFAFRSGRGRDRPRLWDEGRSAIGGGLACPRWPAILVLLDRLRRALPR